MIPIIVKVAESSKISARNIELLRAISFEHMKNLVGCTDNLGAIVIEGIEESEYDQFKEFILEYDKDRDRKVFFYLKKEDETTAGLADELEYDIYLDLYKLQAAIGELIGVDVSTDIHQFGKIGSENIGIASFDETIKCDDSSKELEEVEEHADKIQVEDPEESQDLEESICLEESACQEDVVNQEEDTESTYENREATETVDSIIGINKKLEEALGEVAKIKGRAENNVKEALKDTAIAKKKAAELEIRLKDEEDARRELQNAKDELTKKLGELGEEVRRLTEANQKMESYKSELERAQQAKEDSDYERALMVNGFVSKLLSECVKHESNIRAYELQVSNLTTRVQDLGKDLLAAEERITTYVSKLSEMDKISDDLDVRVEEKTKELGIEIERLRIENNSLQAKAEAERVRAEKEKEKYKTIVKTLGIDEESAPKFLENYKALNTANFAMKKVLKETSEREENERDSRVKAEAMVETLNSSVKRLEASLRTVNIAGNSMGIDMPPIKISSSGLIIGVFGCGSYGITTTAMSIAYKLCAKYRVLFIDLDLAYPKADGWFNMSPVVKEAPGGNGQLTSASAMFNEGVQFVLENSNTLIRRASTGKEGYIDYFSGYYGKIDWAKILISDFSRLFKFACDYYDYVVVDLGKFGGNDQNDTVIKRISEVAYKTVAVSTNDRFEIRTFRMKMAEEKMALNNIHWLANMCMSSSIDETARRIISPAKLSLMPFDQAIMEERSDFTKNRVTRGKWDAICNEILE